mgnify:CR=1 FL=1
MANTDNIIKTEKKLNIFQKIQIIRTELKNTKITKSGKNTYSNYSYMELGDFLPTITELCNKYGIYPEFQFTKENADLTLYDTESELSRKWSMPIEVPSLKNCNEIQNIGGAQTFARRYLYIMAFEISENDIINSMEVDKEQQEAKKKINNSALITIKGLIEETETDIDKFCKFIGVDKVENITNDMLSGVLQNLNKKKKQLENKRKKEEEENKNKVSEEDLPL